jgi:uncharacterized membrane protein YraQ (UPF0718 family)
MEHIDHVTLSFLGYVRELFFPIVLGFIFSGLINEFVPEKSVQKYLGDDSIWAIFTATCVGALLPVCCMGSLPIAVTLRKKGARLGPVLAFLVTTPATSAPALLVSLKLMGVPYTVFMAVVVIVMGFVMGLIGNAVKIPSAQEEGSCSSCCGEDHATHDQTQAPMAKRVERALRYAFIELPRKMGFEILLGAVVASVIVSFEAVRDFVRTQLDGIKGYLILIVIGLLDYVCSTGSVPVANALVQSGVAQGKSMVYLLMGPITSYATLLVIRKEFGGKVLGLYLVVIMICSLLAGLIYDFLFVRNFMG